MNKYVFDYLRIIGFTDNEINYIEDNNEYIFYVNLVHIKKIITILQDLGLDNINIRKTLIKNVYIITEKIEKINLLNNVYFEVLNLNKEELKELIINNPNIYMISVSELSNNINYLKEHNYGVDAIKKFLLTYPQVTSMSPEEFRNLVKFD